MNMKKILFGICAFLSFSCSFGLYMQIPLMIRLYENGVDKTKLINGDNKSVAIRLK